MRADRKLSTGRGQRRIVAAPTSLGSGRSGKEGEKGLQDKGSPSWGLLSGCLHIFLSRDRVWREGDSRGENGDNLPFLTKNCERHFGPALGLELDGVRLAAGACLS